MRTLEHWLVLKCLLWPACHVINLTVLILQMSWTTVNRVLLTKSPRFNVLTVIRLRSEDFRFRRATRFAETLDDKPRECNKFTEVVTHFLRSCRFRGELHSAGAEVASADHFG